MDSEEERLRSSIDRRRGTETRIDDNQMKGMTTSVSDSRKGVEMKRERDLQQLGKSSEARTEAESSMYECAQVQSTPSRVARSLTGMRRAPGRYAGTRRRAALRGSLQVITGLYSVQSVRFDNQLRALGNTACHSPRSIHHSLCLEGPPHIHDHLAHFALSPLVANLPPPPLNAIGQTPQDRNLRRADACVARLAIAPDERKQEIPAGEPPSLLVCTQRVLNAATHEPVPVAAIVVVGQVRGVVMGVR